MQKEYRLAALAIIAGCSLFAWFILFLTGAATPFVSCFTVDSYDRIYIGTQKGINIYEDGKLIKTIDSQTSKGYKLTIDETENIVIATTSKVYTMDLQGNIIQVQEDPYAHTYSQLQYKTRKFTSANGDKYKLVSQMGWTRIVKNGVDTVYRINVLSFATKFLLYIFVLALITLVAWTLREKYIEGQGDGSVVPLIPDDTDDTELRADD